MWSSSSSAFMHRKQVELIALVLTLDDTGLSMDIDLHFEDEESAGVFRGLPLDFDLDFTTSGVKTADPRPSNSSFAGFWEFW